MCIKLVFETSLYYDARSEKHRTRLASNEIFSPSNKILREVCRAKDLSATLVYRSSFFLNKYAFVVYVLRGYAIDYRPVIQYAIGHLVVESSHQDLSLWHVQLREG